MRGAVRGRARPAAVATTVVAVLAYAWWATGLRPFTDPALAATIGGGLAAMVAGALRRRSPGPVHAAPSGGMAVWVALFAALTAWEVAAFLQQPRADHPTLSSISNSVLDAHPVRALAFVVWLAVAAELARR